jgi:quercetin dioxygenase-like cupin family protein
MAKRRSSASGRFVTTKSAQVESTPRGTHWWLSRPGLTDTQQLILVRVTMPAGASHDFHYHPSREEIIYIVDGVAEQWVDREKQMLKAGDSAFIPENVVHAIYNTSKKPMTFLAILSPAEAEGPFLIDCADEGPWRTLRQASRVTARRPGPGQKKAR